MGIATHGIRQNIGGQIIADKHTIAQHIGRHSNDMHDIIIRGQTIDIQATTAYDTIQHMHGHKIGGQDNMHAKHRQKHIIHDATMHASKHAGMYIGARQMISIHEIIAHGGINTKAVQTVTHPLIEIIIQITHRSIDDKHIIGNQRDKEIRHIKDNPTNEIKQHGSTIIL